MKKKVVTALGGFLGLMLLFTVLSRAADSGGIPRVTVEKPEKRIIEHKVTATGKVEENREAAVSVLADQIVKAIYVKEGQTVEKGDVLFEVDLEELEEQILTAKQEIEKLKLQTADSESSQNAQAQKQGVTQNRAAEDYHKAQTQGDEAVAQAEEELAQARETLETFRKSQKGQASGGTDQVKETLEKTAKEKEKALESAKDDRKNLEKEKEELEAQIASLEQELETAKKQQAEAEKKAKEEQEAEKAAQEKAKEKSQEKPAEENSKVSQLEETLAEKKEELKEKETALKEAKAQEEKAEKQSQQAAEAVKQYEEDQKANEENSSQATEEQLKAAVEEKEAAYETAVQERENNLTTAGRALEDASLPEGSDSSGKINELDIQQKERALKKLEALKEKNGQVKAPVKGVVTKISITTGDRTPDGTAVLLADISSGVRLIVPIDEEQEKYLARKDPVTGESGDGKKKLEDLTVDSLTTGEEADGYEAVISLPKDAFEIGTMASMTAVKQSGPYGVCVPLEALHEENGIYYVLVLSEIKSVLGDELEARRLDVEVIEKNETYAAIEESSLTSDQQVIVGSDRSIQDGSRVRLEE